MAIGAYGDGATGCREGTGSVTLLYGSAKGLTARGSDRWTQASPGLKGRPVESGGFGGTLTIGHFTGRAGADLALASTDGQSNGRINAIRGGKRGLTARGDQLWTTRSLCRSERKRFNSQFAWSVTAGSFGHDAGGRRGRSGGKPSDPVERACDQPSVDQKAEFVVLLRQLRPGSSNLQIRSNRRLNRVLLTNVPVAHLPVPRQDASGAGMCPSCCSIDATS